PRRDDNASHSGIAHVAFDHEYSLRSRDFIISWLNPTPHAQAVYASCSASPPPHRNTRFQAARYGFTWAGLAPADRASFAWRLHSFDHLIGAGKQCRGYFEAERPGGLEVDDQLHLRGPLDWQISRLFAFENSSGVNADLTIVIRLTGSVAQHAAGRGERAILMDRGHRVAERQCGELFASGREECTGADDERAWSELGQGCKDRIKIALGARRQDMELQPQAAGRRLQVARKAFSKSGRGRVDEHTKDRRPGQQFVQQPQPLRS